MSKDQIGSQSLECGGSGEQDEDEGKELKRSSAHAGDLGEKFGFHPASQCKPVIPALRG